MPSPLHFLNSKLIACARNFPFSGWKKIAGFPPISCPGEGRVLLLVIKPGDFWMALWSAYSWMFHLPQKPQLRVIMDGRLQPAQQELANRLFPGATLIETSQWLQYDSHATGGYEGFIAKHPFGRKMASILKQQLLRDTLYTDADILIFAPPHELESVFETGVYRYLAETFDHSFDPVAAAKLPHPVNRRCNAGLLALPKNSFSKSDLACILPCFENWSSQTSEWATEQTVMSSLLSGKDAKPLNMAEYLNTTEGFFLWERNRNLSEVVLRHYTGTVRHRFLFEGVPHFLKTSGLK